MQASLLHGKVLRNLTRLVILLAVCLLLRSASFISSFHGTLKTFSLFEPGDLIYEVSQGFPAVKCLVPVAAICSLKSPS